jgi:hypothetical protein
LPKLKETEEQQMDNLTRAYLAYYQELYSLSDEEVAIKMHCTRQTYQNKKRRPDTFTLKELRKLCKVLKLTDEAKTSIM